MQVEPRRELHVGPGPSPSVLHGEGSEELAAVALRYNCYGSDLAYLAKRIAAAKGTMRSEVRDVIFPPTKKEE